VRDFRLGAALLRNQHFWLSSGRQSVFISASQSEKLGECNNFMRTKFRHLFIMLASLAGVYPAPAQTTSLSIAPAGMALIPAGAFTMGDTLDGEKDAIPVSVTVSAFYMDTNLVSYRQWQSVYSYATSHGYGFDHAGLGKAPDHPVQSVDWFDVVKWSNARSQQAGLTPVYYTDAGLTQVYTNGDPGYPIGNTNRVYANWGANGYRLPTEAEWEKAARGGLSGKRFPWGDTISESKANYRGNTNDLTYDSGPNGYNKEGQIGGAPCTSPVGYFAPNGFGLYDMAGNVYEWCWDWYGTPYAGGSDPRGPANGGMGVLRGGVWADVASRARCADRVDYYQRDSNIGAGFRCVRGH
jgi:formylglycine-generating enzyme required for sulfatase activity